MSYARTTWSNGDTITAAKLNNIEEGILGNESDISNVNTNLGNDISALQGTVASTYDSSSTYEVGDYVYYNDVLYRCTTAITTAEAWTSGHWTAVVLGDDVTDLKSALDKYDNPFEETIPAYTSGIIGISIIDPAESNYTSYRISTIRKNSSWHWYMTLQGYNGTDWVNIDSIESEYSADAVYPMVETLFSNNNKYVAVIDWNYVQPANISTSGITGIVLKNNVVNKPFINALAKINTNQTNIANLTTNEQMYNSPFSVVVPSSISGIIGINIYNSTYAIYEYYKISSIRHNSTWYMYASLQGWDGSAWVNIDNVEIRIASATSPQPLVEVLDSKYHRFTMTVVWSMMGSSISLSSKDYRLKYTSVNYKQIELQADIDTLYNAVSIPSFELADHIKHVVTVKSDGTGDYASIASAYASITDSALDNQYEIVVYPGTYNENNLEPPAYTHTHGIYPMQTIVDSSGLYDSENPDLSVFDQGHAPSKLSNMVIKSQTKYCVHQDVELRGVTLINENLYCIRLTGGSSETSVIGIGADFDGAKFVWRNCTFVNGAVSAHTNPNNLPNANQHIIYDNCKFINSYVWLGIAGNTYGRYVCEINGCETLKGDKTLHLKCGNAITGVDVNCPWEIIGSDNKNFIVQFDKTADSDAPDEWWENINTTDKTYITAAESITAGQFVDIGGGICEANADTFTVLGVALASGNQGDVIPVWTGNAIKYTGTNGEYGIGADGALSASATTKIGRVYSNIFYRN